VNILIFGASGATGHELIKQALEQGHIVTAFVRNPAKLKITHNNLKVVQGDIVDTLSVNNAIKDQDAVLSALGASSPFTYDQAVVDGMHNIVTSMEKSVVKRLIYLSFIGVKESRNDAGFVIKYITPVLLRTEIKGHELREKIIQQSILAWTIVRAATLTKGKKKGTYRSGERLSSGSFVVSISRADVADFMLKQIVDSSFIRKETRIMY
jgi:putative NADH-flavin reductase